MCVYKTVYICLIYNDNNGSERGENIIIPDLHAALMPPPKALILPPPTDHLPSPSPIPPLPLEAKERTGG